MIKDKHIIKVKQVTMYYNNKKYDNLANIRIAHTTYVIQTITTLFWQFFFTFSMVALTVYNDYVNHIIKVRSDRLLLFGGIGCILMLIHIISSDKKTLTQLSLLTIFQTIILCATSVSYSIDNIIVSIMSTIGITIGLGVYALTTKYNYTQWTSLFTTGLVCLFTMSISNLWIQSSFIDNIEVYIGTMIFLGYIIIDVQYYLHKKTSVIYYNDEDLYISASLNIYIDILNIFMRLLTIFSKYENKTKNKYKKRHGWI